MSSKDRKLTGIQLSVEAQELFYALRKTTKLKTGDIVEPALILLTRAMLERGLVSKEALELHKTFFRDNYAPPVEPSISATTMSSILDSIVGK